MNTITHIDQARAAVLDLLMQHTRKKKTFRQALLIEDLFARLRVVLWEDENIPDDIKEAIRRDLVEAGGPFGAGCAWYNDISQPGSIDRLALDEAWNKARKFAPKIRISLRYRRGNWLNPMLAAPWEKDSHTRIVSFYSLKGGVGRTTALAAFAIQRARQGEKVAVLDLDLDAPGAGTLLNPEAGTIGAPWGIVDYLLEQSVLKTPNLRDYYYLCSRPEITHQGTLYVFPAGAYNEHYLGKLARVDIELLSNSHTHPLIALLEQIRSELNPDWLLIDSRAGLSEVAGLGLSGIAHLNVLFGTFSEQSWLGLQQIIQRFGKERIHNDQPQVDCLLVQAMTPANPTLARLAEQDFAKRAEDIFRKLYFVKNPQNPEEDKFWYIRDIDNTDAPHIPIAIHYSDALAFFHSLGDIADRLARDDDYVKLSQRIVGRFRKAA